MWTGGDVDELVSPYSSAVEGCCQSMTDLVTVAEATRRTFPVAVKGNEQVRGRSDSEDSESLATWPKSALRQWGRTRPCRDFCITDEVLPADLNNMPRWHFV